MTKTDGERLVEKRVRAALAKSPHAQVHANVRWLAATRPGGPVRDGEIDLVMVHPEFGILAIEVKDGPVSRDSYGRWFAGHRPLDENPFQQVETGKHAIADKIAANPAWHGPKPRMLHAVAFPDTDRASVAPGRDLGPDAPIDLVMDRADLATTAATVSALDRTLRHWSGDGARDRTLSESQLAMILDTLEPEIRLRPLLRGDIQAGEIEALAPTHHQVSILRTLRNQRRALINGGAGSGKTLVAIEKARQLASEGYRTLFVCFNQPLARALAGHVDLGPLIARGNLTVTTFHELCLRLGTEAGMLPPQPKPVPPDWFNVVLPHALADGMAAVGGRWHALVIDEGQDFDADWITTLELLLSDPDGDVMYVFHDPAQAIYRADACSELGLQEFELSGNCRNPKPIHDFAYRWYTGDVPSEPMRDDGRDPEIVIAQPGGETVDAVRDALSRVCHAEKVPKDQVVVLLGGSLSDSDIWRQRRFKGGFELWNGNVTDAGEPRGLAFDAVLPQPRGTILCDSIRRFKGLECPVVILAEVRPDAEHLGRLLYVGASRASQHLIVVVPPELALTMITNSH